MIMRWLVIIATFGFYSSATTIAQIVDAADFAKAFNYPAEKLRVTDVTQQVREKYGDAIFLAFSIAGEGRTFAPTSVVLAREGSLLNERMQNKLAQALEESPTASDTKPSIKRFSMPN